MVTLADEAGAGTAEVGVARRDFLLVAATSFVAVGAVVALWPFLDSMNPSADVQALATTEVDLAPVQLGQRITVLWHGAPAFIDHRTPREIAEAEADNNSPSLIDPARDEDRVKRKEWLIVVNVCTHLGCVPPGTARHRSKGPVGWLVLPVPRLAVRHLGPRAPRPRAQEPHGAALSFRGRHQACHWPVLGVGMPAPASTLRSVGRLVTPYYTAQARVALRLGPLPLGTVAEKWVGSALLAAVIAAELIQVSLAVLVNQWNARFYNALQDHNLSIFWHEIAVFSVIAAAFIAVAVYQLYLNQWLQIRWRRWMTRRYADRWLDGGTHYRMRRTGDPADNPDQRIADDIALFVNRTLTLRIGLISSVTALVSFAIILWGVSAQAPLLIAGRTYAIPGYLVWIAAAFAMVGTSGAHAIGRALVGLNFNQQRFEADFRFALVRLRENSEQIALLGGEPAERVLLDRRFANVIANWYGIMKKQKRLTFFTAGYSQTAVVLPFLIISPSFFAGLIPLGHPDAGIRRVRPGAGRLLVLRDRLCADCRMARGGSPARRL
jgi:ubiquinol-cytochrome c reductase iron-sulfur subunit